MSESGLALVGALLCAVAAALVYLGTVRRNGTRLNATFALPAAVVLLATGVVAFSRVLGPAESVYAVILVLMIALTGLPFAVAALSRRRKHGS